MKDSADKNKEFDDINKIITQDDIKLQIDTAKSLVEGPNTAYKSDIES